MRAISSAINLRSFTFAWIIRDLWSLIFTLAHRMTQYPTCIVSTIVPRPTIPPCIWSTVWSRRCRDRRESSHMPWKWAPPQNEYCRIRWGSGYYRLLRLVSSCCSNSLDRQLNERVKQLTTLWNTRKSTISSQCQKWYGSGQITVPGILIQDTIGVNLQRREGRTLYLVWSCRLPGICSRPSSHLHCTEDSSPEIIEIQR